MADRRRLVAFGPAAAVVALQLVAFPVPAGVWLQGLVIGLLNALVVLGMMLVYRANRVINLAQASIGTFPSAVAIGVILLGAPDGRGMAMLTGSAGIAVAVAAVAIFRLDVSRALVAGLVGAAALGLATVAASHLGYFGGLGIGLVIAMLTGAGIDAVVVRRFRTSPRLVLTVATIGLAQFFAVWALLVPQMWHRFQLSDGAHTAFGVPGNLSFTVGQTVFHGDEVLAVVVTVVVMVVVAQCLRRTDVGIAVRAAADRSDRAAMLGVPVPRLEAGVWVVASVLAFLGTFLQAAILGLELTPGVGLRIMVAALAAMALGGFSTLPSTLVSAVAIGILAEATGPAGGHSLTTTDTVLAVVVLLGLLLRRPSGRRADRDGVSSWQASVEPRAVPPELARLRAIVTARRLGYASAVAIAVAVPVVLTPSQDFRAATVVSLAVLALSVVVLTGWTGQVSLGQMAFAASGAAVAAVATATWHFDLTLTLLLAGVVGALFAVVVGIPSLRWQGIFLAVTTLAVSLAVTGYVLNPTEAHWIPTDAVYRRPLLGVWDLHGDGTMYEVTLGVLVVALVALAGIRRSRLGRVLLAVRDNGPAAQSCGVRVPLARLSAFCLSGFLAGVAGALLVYVNEGYDVATFAADQGVNVFISAVVGGVASPLGALLGAVVLDGSRSFLTGYWVLLPSAVGVLVVLMVLPGGLAELVFRARDGVLRRFAEERGIEVPSLVADRRVAGRAAVGDVPEGVPLLSTTSDAGAPERPAPPRLPAEPGYLSVRGLDVAYDRVQVLFGVDLDVERGTITALLGTNGAGKSTLLRAIGGVAPVTAGTIELDGVDLVALRPEEVAAAGIAQMPGGQGVFPSLTVDENLRVAAWLMRSDRAAAAARIAEVRGRFEVLDRRRADEAGDLSGGQQQQLALAMALLGRPELLLVDELSLGLAPLVVEQLLGELRTLRDLGTTIVVVEQSVNVALTVADHAFFMEKGEVRFSGSAADLLEVPDLVRAVFLQGASDALRTHSRTSAGHTDTDVATAVPALEAVGLSVSFGGITAVADVHLTVRPGEIVGLIGPNGAGKSTVFDLISGFTAADAGRVRIHGHDVSSQPPSSRARAGLGRSFQDARLFPGLTVTETIALALERWIQAGDPVSAAFRLPARQLTEAAVEERVAELVDVFGLGAFRAKRVGELSTGSRRMVDLACAVAHGPTVLLLDEPTSGIAQREAEALAPVLLGLRHRLGASLLIVEHDISLISSVSDRLVALDQGAVVTSGPPGDVLDHPDVVASYLGGSTEALHRSDPITGGPA